MPTPGVEDAVCVCAPLGPSCSPPGGEEASGGEHRAVRVSRGWQGCAGVRALYSTGNGWSATPGGLGGEGDCPALYRSRLPAAGGCRGSRCSGSASGYGVSTLGEADFVSQPVGRECGVRTREQAPAHPGQVRPSVLCQRTGQPVAAEVTAPRAPAAGVPTPRGCRAQQGPLPYTPPCTPGPPFVLEPPTSPRGHGCRCRPPAGLSKTPPST